MKRWHVLLVAVLAMCVTGVAWGDVVVLNSMGEPDSNRPGEDIPEWLDGCDGSVNTTDTAGEGSTASVEVVSTAGFSEIFNDHYDDPIDASCCVGYFNFYIKVVEGSIDYLEIYGTSDGWDDEGIGWFEIDVSGWGSEWTYVSMELDADSNGGTWDGWGDFDYSNFQTVGLGYDNTDAVILTDHWTLSTTSEEGELGAAGEPCTPTEVYGEPSDMCILSGTLDVDEDVIIGMTMGGELVEITEAGFWTEQGGWGAGDYNNIPDDLGTLENGLIGLTIDEDILAGGLEATNPGETSWVWYDVVNLCDCTVSLADVQGVHKAEETDDVTLTAETALEGTIQWFKDGEEIPDETGEELVLLDVTTDDSGLYSIVLTTEDGGAYAEFESDGHILVVFPLGEMPLAGGLGLGLIAGACALAGAVTIRRKK